MNRRPMFWLGGLAALALAFVVGAFAATSALVLMRSPRADGTIATAARLGSALFQADNNVDVDEGEDDANGDADAPEDEHPCGGKLGHFMRMHPGMAGVVATLQDGTIAGVTDDGPAAEAGLEAGDRITAIDGVAVEDGGLAEAIGARAPGETVALTVERDGEALELSATLAEHPDDAERGFLGIMLGGPAVFERRIVGPDGERIEVVPGVGMHGLPLPEALRERLEGLAEDAPFAIAGAVVMAAAEDGPAASAGLGEGDVIEAVDGEELDGPDALVDAVAAKAPGDVVALTVTGADGTSREVSVTLGERPDDAERAWLGIEAGPFIRIDRTGDEGEGDVQFEFGGGHARPGMRWFFGDGEEAGAPDELAVPAMPAMPAVPAMRLRGQGGTL